MTSLIKSNGHQNEKNQPNQRKCNHHWKWSGYISMQKIRQFRPCVLRKVSETLNMTSFTEWRITKENQQTMTKILSVLKIGYISMKNYRPFPSCIFQEMLGYPKFDPFHLVKVASKGGKSTDCDHNLINSACGQDTSSLKISGHFLHAFFRKCPETSLGGWTDGQISHNF